MKKRQYEDYIADITGAIESVERFVRGFTFEDFEKDEKTIFAAVRALEIIGEAVKNIPASAKNKYKKVPWNKASDMRNKLIHEYFGVNIKVVWKTIKEDIPDLKKKMSEILKEMKANKLI